MSDWEILGIDPTEDPLAVKRAYNRKLREHPPEKDPEGFMRLRAAYERVSESLERRAQAEPFPIHPPAPPEDREGSRALDEGHSGADEFRSPPGGSLGHPAKWTREPGVGRSVEFPGDHEVHALWAFFRELWTHARAEPDHPLWKELLELLEADEVFRPLFGRRLAAFFEGCFQDDDWQDVSEVLLWRLSVALGWDRDCRSVEALVGRSVESTLERWRGKTALDSLEVRFRQNWKRWGGEQAPDWEDFFELVGRDPTLREHFEPVGWRLLAELAPERFQQEETFWLRTRMGDLMYLNRLPKTTPEETLRLPAGPPPPPPVVELQPQDRAILWGIGLVGLAFAVFLGYQVAKRILGG